jgi:heterotetrameric sarcosine oxidase gamma subunit
MADQLVTMDGYPRRTKVRLRIGMSAAKEATPHGLPAMLEAKTEAAVTVLSLGPDQWLLVSDQLSAEQLIEMCADELANVRHHAVDVSAALNCALVRGERAPVLLSMGACIDWSVQCTRTRFASVPVVVHRCADTSFDLYYDRSLRHYLDQWMSHALRDPLLTVR